MPTPPQNADLSNTGAPAPDPSFTFRIQRVQEWTLGTVIVAAVSLGIWIGTLTTKLDHIERFVDSANDGSTGLFVRLASIQTTLDLLNKNGDRESARIENPVHLPSIVIRPDMPLQPQGQIFDKLVEYKFIEDLLKTESKPTEPAPAKPGPPAVTPSSPDLLSERARWLGEIKEIALAQLLDLENEVTTDKTLTSASRLRLMNLINLQRERVQTLSPAALP